MNNTTTTTTTISPCIVLSWSPGMLGIRDGTLYLCIMGALFHAIFWIQFFLFSSVRQRGMIWLYIYLLTDLFLIGRYFLFYGQRISNVCVPRQARLILCYFEAISKFYTNTIQSYILLGLNICRYIQIVHNRNVYTKHIRLLILANLIIYIIPMINIIFQFFINWTQITKQLGGLCDILYLSIYIQLYNLIITYIIPVFLNLIFLGLCIRYINFTGNIRNEQILNNRRKFHRRLLIQSILFYSIWIVLWSPYILSFPFVNDNSLIGTVTSMLNYVQIVIDPIVVAIIDIRFLKTWKTTYTRFLTNRQRRIHPSLVTTVVKRH